jgi:hypothetical protein
MKNRVIGRKQFKKIIKLDVRFIGDLLRVGVIPMKAIYLCYVELLNNYLKEYDVLEETKIHENPEDQLEGLVELIDKSKIVNYF